MSSNAGGESAGLAVGKRSIFVAPAAGERGIFIGVEALVRESADLASQQPEHHR